MEQPLCGQPVVEVCSDHVGFACIVVEEIGSAVVGLRGSCLPLQCRVAFSCHWVCFCAGSRLSFGARSSRIAGWILHYFLKPAIALTSEMLH